MDRQLLIPFIVSLAFFMESLDSTVLNTAIPAMAISLNVNPLDLKMALISYLISLAIFIPISGWLADKFGAKKIFILALTIFTLSSVWCGFAQHLYELVIARLLQGLGGALGFPVGRLIIIKVFGRENYILKMNNVLSFGIFGMMLGPVVGGYLTHYFSWHWIFWINIPIGLLSIWFAYLILPEFKPVPVPKLDYLGLVYFGGGLGGFTLGLALISESQTKLLGPALLIFISCLTLILYVYHSKNRTQQLININLLKLKTFRIAALGNLISRLGLGGLPFLLPLLLQLNFHYQPQQAGWLLAPIAIGVLLSRPYNIKLLKLLGYRHYLIFNAILASLCIWAFIGIRINTSIFYISGITLLYGFLLSLQYSALNSLAYADIPHEELSSATSLIGTSQQISQSFGVAMSAILIHSLSVLLFNQITLSSKIFDYTLYSSTAEATLSPS